MYTDTVLKVILMTFFVVLQANYQLVLPNIRDYLSDIGAAVALAGVVIGCCDIASIPGTIGTIQDILRISTVTAMSYHMNLSLQ